MFPTTHWFTAKATASASATIASCPQRRGLLGWKDSNSEMSSQIIPLKGRTDFRGPAEFQPQRLFAFELRRWGYAARAWCQDLGRMPARPLVVEAHRRVGKNCRDRRRQLRRSAQKARQTVPREPCRGLTFRSAFRRIAFVPLYRRKALLAGPVHDNKKHANTDRTA